MHIILVYDIDTKRVNDVNKFLKKYLYWRQNSVFEGDIMNSQLEEIKNGLKELIDERIDSIVIYKLPNKKDLKTEIIGVDKSPVEKIF